MTRLAEAQEKYRKLHKAPVEPSLSSEHMPAPHHHHHHHQQQSLATDNDLCPGSHQHTNMDSSVSPGSPRSPSSRNRTANIERPSSRGLGVIEPQRTVCSQSPEHSVFDYTHVGPTTASSITIERSSDPADPWGSVDIPPPGPSPASGRGSQFLSPPAHSYSLLGDSGAREVGSKGTDVFDRLRAKSLRIRHRPNLRTIREKSQSIDTLHK